MARYKGYVRHDPEYRGRGKTKCLQCGTPVSKHSLLGYCNKDSKGYERRMKRFADQRDADGRRKGGAKLR